MTYSGASTASSAREQLGKALEALQQDPNIPDDVMAVAQNIAQAVGALFEAEKASSEPDGKSSVKAALGNLSQTLALLQDVKSEHAGVDVATKSIAETMSQLYPLTTVPSKAPPPQEADKTIEDPQVPKAAGVPAEAQSFQDTTQKDEQQPAFDHERMSMPKVAPKPTGDREKIEANIGATTESNFYVGFSGEISHGGVFLATYEVLGKNTSVNVLVTLPGNFEFRCDGWVRFVRDPFDLSSDDGAEPGMGIQFENLPAEARELVLRFIRKRPPMFYDD
jgi:uncharacterized protein (TIGR02266 family)